MKIVNGRWMDGNDQPIDHFNASGLMKIGRKITALYGDKITYDRINLVCNLDKLNDSEERGLAYMLEEQGMIGKLSGY